MEHDTQPRRRYRGDGSYLDFAGVPLAEPPALVATLPPAGVPYRNIATQRPVCVPQWLRDGFAHHDALRERLHAEMEYVNMLLSVPLDEKERDAMTPTDRATALSVIAHPLREAMQVCANARSSFETLINQLARSDVTQQPWLLQQPAIFRWYSAMGEGSPAQDGSDDTHPTLWSYYALPFECVMLGVTEAQFAQRAAAVYAHYYDHEAALQAHLHAAAVYEDVAAYDLEELWQTRPMLACDSPPEVHPHVLRACAHLATACAAMQLPPQRNSLPHGSHAVLTEDKMLRALATRNTFAVKHMYDAQTLFDHYEHSFVTGSSNNIARRVQQGLHHFARRYHMNAMVALARIKAKEARLNHAIVMMQAAHKLVMEMDSGACGGERADLLGQINTQLHDYERRNASLMQTVSTSAEVAADVVRSVVSTDDLQAVASRLSAMSGKIPTAHRPQKVQLSPISGTS